MISMSSLVMTAWRVRLNVKVSLSIISAGKSLEFKHKYINADKEKLDRWNSQVSFKPRGLVHLTFFPYRYYYQKAGNSACQLNICRTAGSLVNTRYDTAYYNITQACIICFEITLQCQLTTLLFPSSCGKRRQIFLFFFSSIIFKHRNYHFFSQAGHQSHAYHSRQPNCTSHQLHTITSILPRNIHIFSTCSMTGSI